MTCSVDSCKVKYRKLMNDLFFGYSSQFMGLSLFFSLFNLLLYIFHFFNVMV